MKRLLFLVGVSVFLPVAPLSAQQTHAVSGAEKALLGRLENVNTWLGMLAGEVDRTVVVGLVMIPVEGIDLRSGDVVQAFNGKPLTQVDALLREYAAAAVGARIRLTIRRGGETATIAFNKPHPSKVPQLNVQQGTLDGAPRSPGSLR
jgi:S1-C subfamily serine protease